MEKSADGSPVRKVEGLPAVLEFVRRGTIHVGGARMALLDIAGGFFMIRKILEQDLGVVERDLMYRAGIEGATSFVSSALESHLIEPTAEGFERSVDAYSNAGFGNFDLERVNWERSSAVLSCRDTFEGWAYVRNHCPCEQVMCDYTRGVLAGFMRRLRGPSGVQASEIHCVESHCIGKADGLCQFIVGPSEELLKSGHPVPEPAKSLRDQLEALRRELQRQQLDMHQAYSFQTLVGKSAAMRSVYALIARVSDTDAPILISGEPGTGRSHVALTIHHNSERRERPCIHLDCRSLAQPVLEAELFGSEQGGQVARLGALQSAASGSLVLDEIGALPSSLQEQLLAAIRQGQFCRMGGSQPVPLQARLIATSEHDLGREAEGGQFSGALLGAIGAVHIQLPPLRARLEDLLLLARHFLERYSKRNGVPAAALSREALAELMRYSWAGNVKELESVIEQAAAVSGGPQIRPEDLRLPRGPAPGAHLYSSGTLQAAVELAEKQILLQALDRHRWRRGETARELAITRATLYNKMRKYGLLGS